MKNNQTRHAEHGYRLCIRKYVSKIQTGVNRSSGRLHDCLGILVIFKHEKIIFSVFLCL